MGYRKHMDLLTWIYGDERSPGLLKKEMTSEKEKWDGLLFVFRVLL